MIEYLLAASFAMQAYGMYEGAQEAKKAAKLQKEDLSLQRESLRLSEEARKMKEDLAEAKARSDARRARAAMITKAAVSGASESSAQTAMEESIITQVESGLATQRELSGISSDQSRLAERRLSIASQAIPSTGDIDLDAILGIGAAALSTGVSAYALSSGSTKPDNRPFVGPEVPEWVELNTPYSDEFVGPRR